MVTAGRLPRVGSHHGRRRSRGKRTRGAGRRKKDLGGQARSLAPVAEFGRRGGACACRPSGRLKGGPMGTDFWVNKRVVVTGGHGFLGSFVAEKLRERGASELFLPRSRDFDLRSSADVERLFTETRPDVLIHLAAVVGGIGANRRHPGRYFYENAIMGLQIIESARRHQLAKLVCL